jgi:bifunctional DNA-binding transcriptional regulator/antitoxin component of YhaV-PrlF toxin-antitoxin module
MSTHRTIISSKGQVVIPVPLREQLGLTKGTLATWSEREGTLVLTPITKDRLRQLRGILKPAPGRPSGFDALFEERERAHRRDK